MDTNLNIFSYNYTCTYIIGGYIGSDIVIALFDQVSLASQQYQGNENSAMVMINASILIATKMKHSCAKP